MIVGSLSIVVPVGPGEDRWRDLVRELAGFVRPRDEILLSATTIEPPGLPRSARWLQGPVGRALQLNTGARAARGEIAWFLHADCRPGPEHWRELLLALASRPDALHYFDVSYLPEGPRWLNSLLRVNEAGSLFRSRRLGLPFGDQGLCLRRSTFWALGGFPGLARFGEDHLFVWRARRAGVRASPVGLALPTSPRKFVERGWLRTTLVHQALTWAQAVPEALRAIPPSLRLR